MRMRRTQAYLGSTVAGRLMYGCAGLILVLGVGSHEVGYANCQGGPEESYFRWAMVEDASPLPNGLMWVGYREQPNGNPTHASLHRVVRVLPGSAATLPTQEAERFTVLVLDGTLAPVSYVIMTKPLYYGSELDEIGLPRQLWLDADEDGVNGNEVIAPPVVSDIIVTGTVTSSTSSE